MSRSAILPVVILVLLSSSSHAEKIHIFLLGGQSNADGRGSNSGLPAELQSPQTDVPFYWGKAATNGETDPNEIELNYDYLKPGSSRTGEFGPEVTFGRAMADYYAASGKKVAIIKHAQGATDLSNQWKGGGDGTTAGDGGIYQVFQHVVSAGLTAIQDGPPTGGREPSEISIEGMIWMQGERDTRNLADSLAYEDNLRDFIADVRSTYGENLPFVIGQLSSNQTALNSTYRENVRAAQAAVASSVPNTALVNTNSFALKSDNLHFSADGQQDLGAAFATQMQSLIVPDDCADFDGDGFVTGLDFLVWQANFGLTNGATKTQGDADFNGTVDGKDLSIWETQYGLTAMTNIASVPEPGTFIMTFPLLLFWNRLR